MTAKLRLYHGGTLNEPRSRVWATADHDYAAAYGLGDILREMELLTRRISRSLAVETLGIELKRIDE